jgi:ferric-dicitrate binding protein FerR (iron transport regulator)
MTHEILEADRLGQDAAPWHGRLSAVRSETRLSAIWPEFERWWLADPRHQLAFHRVTRGQRTELGQTRALGADRADLLVT